MDQLVKMNEETLDVKFRINDECVTLSVQVDGSDHLFKITSKQTLNLLWKLYIPSILFYIILIGMFNMFINMSLL